MFLIGESKPNEPVTTIIGVAEDMDTVLNWYRLHTRFPPMAERNFLERFRTAGFIEKEWVRFYPEGHYCVQYVTFWASGTFDSEHALAKKTRKERKQNAKQT